MFNKLFDLYYNQISNKEIKEDIYTFFINEMNSSYLDNNSTARIVIDFMAGMTDNFFIHQYNKYSF